MAEPAADIQPALVGDLELAARVSTVLHGQQRRRKKRRLALSAVGGRMPEDFGLVADEITGIDDEIGRERADTSEALESRPQMRAAQVVV